MEYILGVFISLVAQFSKERLSKLGTLTLVFILSVSATISYFYASENEILLKNITQILITAGAFHNFILRRFE